MSERHPYALLRCDACGCLVDAPLARSDVDARYQRSGEGPADTDLGAGAAGSSAADSPSGSGLLVFVRSGEVRYEEPPLCARCSVAIGVTALVRWAEEEEEG